MQKMKIVITTSSSLVMPYPSLKFKFKAGLGKAETALHDSMYCKYRNKSNIQVTYYIYGYNLDERARG